MDNEQILSERTYSEAFLQRRKIYDICKNVRVEMGDNETNIEQKTWRCNENLEEIITKDVSAVINDK